MKKNNYKVSVKMKDGFYSQSDGMIIMKDEFKKIGDKEALAIVEKMESLNSELYAHIGGC